MNILLTFTGFHDPFVPAGIEGQTTAGPILTVVGEKDFDHVYLFCTPRLVERSEQTRLAIEERHPKTTAHILDVPLKDPTNYLGILRQIRSHFKTINESHAGASYSISVSSGTPHMHASWLLLAASGEIPAKVLQSTPPEFVSEGKSRVKEIDLAQPDFPIITRSLREIHDSSDEDTEISNACRELGIIGRDPAFLKALREAYIYASYDNVHVLLLGETGSGKEQFAKFIHGLSQRAARPLLTLNCSSIPENLLESQLFGHKRGAFTGAASDQIGKFKAADGGILFLDELGELPMTSQAKLLRVLDSGEIEPVGTNKPSKVDVKVIAATNRDIKKMILEGTFREDLYQRFSSTIRIPSLNQRKSDIPSLALHFLQGWNNQYQKQRRFSTDAIAELTAHYWPGNVRELAKVVKLSAMLCSKAVIAPEDLRFDESSTELPSRNLPEPVEGFSLMSFLEEIKRQLIERALVKSGNVQAKAARMLDLTPQAINQYLKARQDKRT
jgi:DNA-binding NtrC family response regulator